MVNIVTDFFYMFEDYDRDACQAWEVFLVVKTAKTISDYPLLHRY